MYKLGKTYQITITYPQWQKNVPNGRKIGRPNSHIIYQHLPLQDPSKFTQIGIFGLDMCHLATLDLKRENSLGSQKLRMVGKFLHIWRLFSLGSFYCISSPDF
jgi:hypothetical protein